MDVTIDDGSRDQDAIDFGWGYALLDRLWMEVWVR